MKIAFIGGRDIHTLGGIETYMYHLCSELVERGYQPIVYCESDHIGVEYVNGFKVVHWVSPKSIYVCKIWLGLRSTLHALFREKNVRVFHYNAWPPSLWSWIPRLMGRTSVMMGHGLEWKHTKYSSWQKKLMRFMERWTAYTNTHLIMCSDVQTAYFKEKYGRKCITVPGAIDLPDLLQIPHSGILARYALSPRKYFLYLGRLSKEKNPDYLIRAFLKGHMGDFKLVIAGANDTAPDYVQSLHSLAANSSDIVFTGAVYGEEKACLLYNCMAFCIPSTTEGLSIALLEAMSYAKPVIASDIDANKEALGDISANLWVKAEDEDSLSRQIVYCVEHVPEMEKVGLLNRKRAEDFYTWDKTTKKYIDYVNSII